MKCGVLIFGLSMPIVIIIIIIQGNFIENRTICKQIAAAKVLLLFVNTVCDITAHDINVLDQSALSTYEWQCIMYL